MIMEFKLRKWEKSDIDSMVKYANNINVAKYLTDQFPHPYAKEDAEAYLNLIENDNPIKVFAIDVNGEGVGSVGIFPQNDIHRKNAEIGYWLAEEFWGKGIMSEAIRQITDYGFKTFDVTRIFARPFDVNIASQKALLKAGYTFEAKFEKALYKNGEYCDELYFSIKKDCEFSPVVVKP